jgi:hypothetical protein
MFVPNNVHYKFVENTPLAGFQQVTCDCREALFSHFAIWADKLDRVEHNFPCPLKSPLSVDPLINGTTLIFHF